ELHAPDGKFLVPDAHDLALLGLGGDFQKIRQGIALDDQRMVAGGGERIRHAFEQFLTVVFNQRRFAVHYAIVDHHRRAESVADALVPQANAEGRGRPAKLANDVVREPGLARRAWAW